MGVVQALSLTAVLLLSLYGVACLLVGAALRWLRPRKSRLQLMLPLDADSEDVEMQVRFALELASRWRLPLAVSHRGLSGEQLRIVQVLLRDDTTPCILQNACEAEQNHV